MARETVLTPEGLEELKAKIEHLRGDRRREVAERIKEAREFGDISENAEYDDAKNEQAMLEKQISDLEEKLRNARVIDAKDVDTDAVSIGATVHVKDQKTDKSTKFKIVGSAEANPSENKLSNESPVGRALIGHKRGETVSVQVPARPRPQAEDHQDRALVIGRRGHRRALRRSAARVSAAWTTRREAEARLQRLREQGIDPFPHEFRRGHADRRDPRAP